MKATILHNPSCGTSRKTLDILRDSGADVTVREYLKDSPSRAELEQLYERAGITSSPRGLYQVSRGVNTPTYLIFRPYQSISEFDSDSATIGGRDVIETMTTATKLNDGSPATSGATQAYAVGLSVGTLRGLRN